MECEDHDPCNHDRNFDVEAVKKEINRGRRLVSINDFTTHIRQADPGEGQLSKESLFE